MKVNSENPLPLYYQVYASLLSRIQQQEFAPGDALPPERQLVKDYGVSRITIVKALDLLAGENLIERQHGRGTFVIEADNHTADVKTIAFLPGGLLHPYHYSVQMGIAQVIADQRCHLHVIGLYENSGTDLATVSDMLLQDVDGLIIYPKDRRGLRLFQQLQSRQFPMVMVDRYYPELDTDYVVFDGHQASYELTKTLIARGHRRIAFVTRHELETTSIQNRLAGFHQAMHDHEIDVSDDLLWLDIYASYNPLITTGNSAELTQKLQERVERCQPTGLIAVNHDVSERLTYDLMLINTERAKVALAGNQSQDYELQIEIAGFGHRLPVDYGPYHVATALQPGEALGREAARLLLGRLDGSITGPTQAIQVPIEIAHRAMKGGEADT